MIVTLPRQDMPLLDVELCRAMFEKNPDKMIELLSEWLETNQLTPSQCFNVPPYLREVLSEGQRHTLPN